MKFKSVVFILIFFSVIFYSCDADIDIHNISGEVSLRPDLIVPIGGASVTLGDIISKYITDGKFEIGNDGLEINFLAVDSSEFNFRELNLLNNNSGFVRNFYPSKFGNSFISPHQSIPTVYSNDTLKLAINNQNQNSDRIDSIKITSAKLNVTLDVSSDFANIDPSLCKITVTFPPNSIRFIDGSSNKVSVIPVAFGQANSLILNNFMINTSGNSSGIPILITIESKAGDLPLTLTQNSTISCKLGFSELNYSVAYGYFEPNVEASNILQRNINLDKLFPNGSLKFMNPQIKISAESNIGSYLNFKVDYIKAYVSNKQSEAVYAWFDNHTTNSTTVQMKSKPKTPGLWVDTEMRTMDQNWGETNQLFEDEEVADSLEYKFSASVNQELTKSDPTPNFITPDSKIKVKIATTIPFYLNQGSYYDFKDSIQNIFDVVANTLDKYPKNSIETVSLVLNIKNGLPFKTHLIIKLLDSSGNELLTSFVKDYIVDAGTVDADGLVQPGKESNQLLQIKVTNDQLNELRKADMIVYTVRVEGESINSKIHFTKTSTFNLKVGLFVNGKISANLGK